MRFILLLLVLFMPLTSLNALVGFEYDNGWVAVPGEISTNKNAFMLVLWNERQTNTAFLLNRIGSNSVALNVGDGIYRYEVRTREGQVLETGKGNLTPAFGFEIKNHGTGEISLSFNSRARIFIEGYVRRNEKVIVYRRFILDGNTNIVFSGLEGGSEYDLELRAKGFSARTRIMTPLLNVAMNKPVSGTFNRLPESRFMDDSTPAITRINDGRLTWYKGMASSEEISSRDQMALIDMLGAHSIKKVRIIWHGSYYPLRYSLVTSIDGTNWVSDVRKSTDCVRQTAPDNTPLLIDRLTNRINCRYIGVIIKKDENISSRQTLKNVVWLMEIEAYE